LVSSIVSARKLQSQRFQSVIPVRSADQHVVDFIPVTGIAVGIFYLIHQTTTYYTSQASVVSTMTKATMISSLCCTKCLLLVSVDAFCPTNMVLTTRSVVVRPRCARTRNWTRHGTQQRLGSILCLYRGIRICLSPHANSRGSHQCRRFCRYVAKSLLLWTSLLSIIVL
jgi:hypothetical protein